MKVGITYYIPRPIFISTNRGRSVTLRFSGNEARELAKALIAAADYLQPSQFEPIEVHGINDS